MRIIFTFVALVSVVLVPWSSLAPALLSDASGSAISASVPIALAPVARLNPALGILPLAPHDDANEENVQTVTAPTDCTAESMTSSTDLAADPNAPRVVCENGVCRLVRDADQPGATTPARAAAQPPSIRQRLEAAGATHIRVELDSIGQWRCSCSLPVRPGSSIMRRFEATGSNEEEAIQAACRNVEAWLEDRRRE
jgi:hypothetical protein